MADLFRCISPLSSSLEITVEDSPLLRADLRYTVLGSISFPLLEVSRCSM